MFTDDIWKRETISAGDIEVSKPAYVRLIAALTMVAAGFVAIGSIISFSWGFSWPLLIISGLGQIACIFWFLSAKNPVSKASGVASMSILAGLLIGPMVAAHIAVLPQALGVTLGVMTLMSIAGIVYPKVFEGMGPFIMAGLLVLIFGHFLQIGLIYIFDIPEAQNMPLLAWAGVLIFSLSLAYEWSRALSIPYTLNNAIDASGAIILDGINLFIRLLQIMSGQNQSNTRT